MIITKLLLNDFKHANRDKREISVYGEMGHEVIVLYPYRDQDEPEFDERYTFQKLKKKWPDEVNRILSWKFFVLKNELSIIGQIRKLRTDVISCHDIHALRLAWIAGLFKKKKPILIYDSHEFEMGRNTGKKRTAFQKFKIAKEERFLMKRCAFSIMVNDSIADEVQRIHNLKQRPIVLRNTPPLWNREEDKCVETRRSFCQRLRIKDDAFIVMYHGKVTIGRGIEMILEALSMLEDVYFVILGNGRDDYIDEIKGKIEDFGIADRVLFHEAVPIDEVKNYVGAVDAGIIVALPIAKSYYLSLPNKFFENIQSETPVVVSDVPEMSKLVKEYDIGVVVESNAFEIANAIKRLKSNDQLRNHLKENTKTAKQILNWENEKKVLMSAVEKYL